jgi:hypothetical protein
MSLTNAIEQFGFGLDPIVIRHYVAGFKGGKVLNVTDYTETHIKAGHVIICDTQTETYKPMPVSGGKYASLPENHKYVGVAVSSVAKDEPFVAIMHTGEVNDEASPYAIDTIKSAFLAQVPTIVFNHD